MSFLADLVSGNGDGMERYRTRVGIILVENSRRGAGRNKKLSNRNGRNYGRNLSTGIGIIKIETHRSEVGIIRVSTPRILHFRSEELT